MNQSIEIMKRGKKDQKIEAEGIKPVKIDYHVLMRLRLCWMANREPISLR